MFKCHGVKRCGGRKVKLQAALILALYGREVVSFTH
jgi:hypothetical protein